jgi:hypothetical protein
LKGRCKIAFAAGTDDLIPTLLEEMEKLPGDLPIYVVGEFTPPWGKWIPWNPGRSFAENYERMLDDRMVYSCGYWETANDLAASVAGHPRSNEEWLTHETLNLPGPRYDKFVILGQFVHTKDGNDVEQLFISLQDRLYATSCLIVLFTYYLRVKHTGVRAQWIDRWIDTQGSDVTRQHHRGVQVGEGGGR